MSESRTRKAVILENLSHYLTAFVIVMKGISKLEHPEKLGYSLTFILIGLLLAAGTFFHHKFEHLIKNFKAYVFLVESVVMGIVGYLYLKEGKHYIQYPCFLVSFAYLVGLVIYLVKRKKLPAHQHHMYKKEKPSGVSRRFLQRYKLTNSLFVTK